MSSNDENDAAAQPSTEIELRQEVEDLRSALTALQQAPAPAPVRRTVPRGIDEWVLVVRDYNLLAQSLAKTAFVPRNFQGKPDQVTAVMMYGREIGLPPMTTLQNTYEIYGRVGMYAEQLRAMILDAGHEITYDEMTSDRCTLSGRRKGTERWESFTYTMDQAKRAGLYSKKDSQYPIRPVEMLFARASALLAHAMFPDVIRGMRAVEELEDEGDGSNEAPAVQEPARKATATVGRKRAPKAAIEPSSAVTKPDNPPVEIPESAGIPPLPGEAEAPASVTDEPKRMDVDEAIGKAAVEYGAAAERFEREIGEGMHDSIEDEAPQESAPVADRPKPMHTAQTKALQARFKGLGFTDEPQDREQRLLVAEAIVGHPVDSFRAGDGPEHLTYDEAQAIMTQLAPIRTRGDLIEFLSKLAQDAAAEETMTGPDGVEP